MSLLIRLFASIVKSVFLPSRALLDHGRLVCTPHLGASTVEAQLKVAQEIAQQFVDAVQGKGLMGVVRCREWTSWGVWCGRDLVCGTVQGRDHVLQGRGLMGGVVWSRGCSIG